MSLHVLMTADAVGGVWTYAVDLARALGRGGVRVTLAVLGPPPSAPPADLDIRVLDQPLDWTAQTPQQVQAAGRAVAELARALAVDLVHLNSPALADGVPFDRPVLAVSHSDVATWWAAVRGGDLPADLAWRAAQHGAGLRQADAVVAPSLAFARATTQMYGVAATAVLNGRPDPHDPHSPHGAEVHEGHAVLACGRLWDEGKGLAVLDEAAATMRAKVAAVGALSGPNGAQARPAHVHAAGPLPQAELQARLAARPIFCSPALYEPFGLAVLEAAQHGCPLVLSDIPSFRELWDGAARFTPPRDSAVLAATLDALAADPAERERLGQAARLRSARYTDAAMAAGYLDLYRRLAPARERAA